MNDLIGRQAAIDLFPNDALEWDTNGGYIAPHFARRMIEELPSAQPVRHGKWVQRFIKIGGQVFKHGMQCSVCAEPALDNEGDDYLTNYCPNCGAKMDEERKEE